jgi:hypothetical protein
MTLLLLLLACATDPAPAPVAATATAAPTGHTLTFVNHCTETIWVGSIGNAGFDPLAGGGWEMATGATRAIVAPVGWQGRFWPRTGCTFDPTGDCSPGATPCCATGSCLESDNATFGLACAYAGIPPVSLAEPTFDAAGGLGPYDDYDISFVDGWSVPMSMVPDAGTFNPTADPGLQAPWCLSDGCTTAPVCPDAYAVSGSPSSCWSPCQAATNAGSADVNKLCCTCSTGTPCTCPDTCCAGQYGCSPYSVPANPDDMTCDPWNTDTARAWDATAQTYIANVHTACPGVYAWQFDDVNGSYQCRKTDGLVNYTVTFCPASPA